MNSARPMAWGDTGTLFVGWFGVGTVWAITDSGGKTEVKPILTGLKMPTAKVVYDDMPAHVAHGWKYLTFDKAGWLYVPFGPPCNECLPPTSLSQVRRVNPATGQAELMAIGVRNSVGGDIDPRSGDCWFTESARDWISDDLPDPKLAMGHKCSEFTPPVLKLGAHVAPLGMKFYTGKQFPAEYSNNIFIAEHGSWNRHQYQGGSIVRVVTDAQGKNAGQSVFATNWINGGQSYSGRPADIVMAPDGSMLIADDWAGAYRISYAK